MILGTESRVRPLVELTGASPWTTPEEYRDRGHFLTPRLYPTAAFDAWQPASSYAPQPVELPDDYLELSASM